MGTEWCLIPSYDNVTVQPSHDKLHPLLSGAASINHRRFGRPEAPRLSIVFIAISILILVHRFLPLPPIFFSSQLVVVSFSCLLGAG